MSYFKFCVLVLVVSSCGSVKKFVDKKRERNWEIKKYTIDTTVNLGPFHASFRDLPVLKERLMRFYG